MDFLTAKIISNQKLAAKDGFFRLVFQAEKIAATAKSGQFLMISASQNNYPFLKRPMGINHIDKEKGQVGVIYQVKGMGTELMSNLQPGSAVDILGPLGNGWQIEHQAKNICLIGGGSGIGPLLPLAKELHAAGAQLDIIIGGRSAGMIVCEDEFAKYGRLLLASEDATIGKEGMVSIYFADKPSYEHIYCCGPTPMMRAVALWAADKHIPCQVSLEERMGCGYGVCVGCVCKTKDKKNNIAHKRVCCDGPVFAAEEVFFHD